MMMPSLFPPNEDIRALRTLGRDIARRDPKRVPSEAMVKDARSGPKDDDDDDSPSAPSPFPCWRRLLVPPSSSSGVANVSEIP